MQKLNLSEIKRLRKGANLSQRDMAEILGFNSVYPYHRKESGKQEFTADEIYIISNLFGKPLGYFFTNKLAKNASKSMSKEAI